MLQFDVALCCIRSNLGGVIDSERTYHTPQVHLSALVTRQAGKVRRYKSEVASGFMPDVPEFVHAGEKTGLGQSCPDPPQYSLARFSEKKPYESPSCVCVRPTLDCELPGSP